LSSDLRSHTNGLARVILCIAPGQTWRTINQNKYLGKADPSCASNVREWHLMNQSKSIHTRDTSSAKRFKRTPGKSSWEKYGICFIEEPEVMRSEALRLFSKIAQIGWDYLTIHPAKHISVFTIPRRSKMIGIPSGNYARCPDLRSRSRFSASKRLRNSSVYTKVHGIPRFVKVLFPELCCSNRTSRSIVEPMYRFRRVGLQSMYV